MSASCLRSYNMPLPTPEDYAKEPPAMPPHLQLTLLNVPPALDATASLPRPQVLLGAIVNSLAYQLISHLVKYT